MNYRYRKGWKFIANLFNFTAFNHMSRENLGISREYVPPDTPPAAGPHALPLKEWPDDLVCYFGPDGWMKPDDTWESWKESNGRRKGKGFWA